VTTPPATGSLRTDVDDDELGILVVLDILDHGLLDAQQGTP